MPLNTSTVSYLASSSWGHHTRTLELEGGSPCNAYGYLGLRYPKKEKFNIHYLRAKRVFPEVHLVTLQVRVKRVFPVLPRYWYEQAHV